MNNCVTVFVEGPLKVHSSVCILESQENDVSSPAEGAAEAVAATTTSTTRTNEKHSPFFFLNLLCQYVLTVKFSAYSSCFCLIVQKLIFFIFTFAVDVVSALMSWIGQLLYPGCGVELLHPCLS